MFFISSKYWNIEDIWISFWRGFLRGFLRSFSWESFCENFISTLEKIWIWEVGFIVVFMIYIIATIKIPYLKVIKLYNCGEYDTVIVKTKKYYRISCLKYQV